MITACNYSQITDIKHIKGALMTCVIDLGFGVSVWAKVTVQRVFNRPLIMKLEERATAHDEVRIFIRNCLNSKNVILNNLSQNLNGMYKCEMWVERSDGCEITALVEAEVYATNSYDSNTART